MALLITLTHARLRARQGDFRTARRIVREILAATPDNREAQALLESWRGRSGSERTVPREAEPAPVLAADPVELAGRFREALTPGSSPRRRKIERLERWRNHIVGRTDG